MAAIANPTWSETQLMDEATLSAIGIIKGEMQGDKFVWDYEEEDESGSVTLGIWQSTLDERKKKNSGRVLPSGP
jgi:hypothetical protein